MIFAALGGALFKTATAKVIGGLAGAALDTVMQKKQVEKQNQAKEAAYQRQLEAERLEAEKNRALAKSDAASKFTDMSAAAQKAGINPLTALRTTGAAGFGNYGGFASQAVAPVLSKFSFARTFASNAAKGYFDRVTNEPIDKYNKEIRDLELQQRKADLLLTKGQLGKLSNRTMSVEDALRANPMGYSEMRRLDGSMQQVRNDIIVALRKKPGDTIVGEDWTMIYGDFAGEPMGVGDAASSAISPSPVFQKILPPSMGELSQAFKLPAGSVGRRERRMTPFFAQ